MEWEKIVSNDATDKSLISNIYRKLTQLNSKKIQQPNWKMAKDLNIHFSKKDIDDQQAHEKMLNITNY